ncbi:MAG TPA: hypothetical protein VIB00_07325 [Pyrinomonadaceae bacterium]
MNNINPLMLRALIAVALSVSFVIYPPLQLSSASAAISVAPEIKSESQFRSEAARYDAAIRAIGSIASMRLDNTAEFQKAFDVLKRERPNLKFHRSKLIALALSDPAFANAVKKKAPDKSAAESFVKQLNADRQAVLRLDGVQTLQSRMRRSDEADAATLRRAAEHLKAAGEKIKASAPRSSVAPFGEEQEFKVIRANFTESTPAPIDPVSATIIALAVTAVVIMAIAYGSALISNATTDEGQDAVEACNQRNDERFDRCVSEIDCGLGGLLNPFCAAALALCESDWLVRAAACLFAS